MEFSQSQTKNNLARIFAGECQDGARYQFIAKKAKSSGYFYLSTIMKMLAKNEMAHASVIYDYLLKYGGENIENIEIQAGYPFEDYCLEKGFKACSGAEKSQAKNIYPHFAKIAQDEGFEDIANTINLIAEVEMQHSNVLSEMDKLYSTEKLYKKSQETNWKCSNCGHSHTAKQAWEKCPLCSYPQGYVIVSLQAMKE